MEKASKTPLIHMLETIADNKFILGDRLVEVGIGGPTLEATLAAVAMAQGELGQARTLYNWVKKMRGQPIEDVRKTTGKAFASLARIDHWISLIAGLHVTTAAHDLVLSAVLRGRPETASRIRKLVEEQREHLICSREWAEQLLQDRGAVPLRFQQACHDTLTEAEAWLAFLEGETSLKEAGYLPADPPLDEQLRNTLSDLVPEGALHAR